MRKRSAIALAASVLLGIAAAAAPAQAATFLIINNDSAGQGFNDTTPVSPVGGNNGTTVGQQRLNAFQFAANIWGGLLTSNVTIRVGATFGPLSCTSNQGVLGSAGPNTANRDFTGALVANTWYAAAQANALHGSDLGAGDDIGAQFNGSIGTPGCLDLLSWYYGFDSNPGPNQLDFASVLLHELGHGLGFLTFVDLTTGAKFQSLNDVFMLNLENHGASPSDYPSMSNAQRVTASTSTGNLHWTGANVRGASGTLTAGTVGDHVRMYAPNPQESGSSVSHWDKVLTPNQVMEPSYTQPLHNPALELKAFQDIGWPLTATTFALTVNKTGTGTVTSSPAGISCGFTCSFSFNSGTVVTLTATPTAGWIFTGWGGACSGSGSCVVTMNSAQTVSATFTQVFTLSVSKTGNGTVTSSPAGINCGVTCAADFTTGTSVTLIATPAGGSTFGSWGGACSGSGGCSVTMNSAQSVSAAFLAISTTTLTSSANPSALGQPVTFTATVASGGGTPTGSVTFKDGGSTMGTGTLSGGVATFTTSTLTPGFHGISAVYGGDANFTTSTSAGLAESIIVFTATPPRRRF